MKKNQDTSMVYRPMPFLQKRIIDDQQFWCILVHVRINEVLKEVVIYKHAKHPVACTRFRNMTAMYGSSRIRQMTVDYVQLKVKDKVVS